MTNEQWAWLGIVLLATDVTALFWSIVGLPGRAIALFTAATFVGGLAWCLFVGLLPPDVLYIVIVPVSAVLLYKIGTRLDSLWEGARAFVARMTHTRRT
ncbi:MAG: hypothetical protein RL681_83 [Candidatus Parcubacteria bacterium]|jgi:spore maturation protein SpmB